VTTIRTPVAFVPLSREVILPDQTAVCVVMTLTAATGQFSHDTPPRIVTAPLADIDALMTKFVNCGLDDTAVVAPVASHAAVGRGRARAEHEQEQARQRQTGRRLEKSRHD
jgi:hypothetical protein